MTGKRIEQALGYVSLATDFTARLAAQRTRRADLEQEIVLVERRLSATDRRITPEAIGRLGDVILRKLRSDDPSSGRAMPGH